MIPRKASKTVDLQKRVASNLRRSRLALNISQEQLADICGYHRTYIGAIERAERNITLNTLAALATALHLEPIELLSDHEIN